MKNQFTKCVEETRDAVRDHFVAGLGENNAEESSTLNKNGKRVLISAIDL